MQGRSSGSLSFFPLGLALAGLATLHAAPARAGEIVLGPPVDLGAALTPLSPPEDDTYFEESDARVAVAAGADGAVVAWAEGDQLSGALLAHDGTVIDAAAFEYAPAQTSFYRVFGAYGGGRYLFVAKEQAWTHFVVLDEAGHLASTFVYQYECSAGIPAYDGGRFYVPCLGWIVPVDAAASMAEEGFAFGSTPNDQGMQAVDCAGGACTAYGNATFSPEPFYTAFAQRFGPGGAADPPILVGVRDANHASFALARTDGGHVLVSRCFVLPCGDVNGEGREHFVGHFLSEAGAVTPLEPLLFGDGVRSPRLATNGTSLAMAWRTRGGGPGVAGFTREGAARDAAVDLGTSYASSISLTATPAGDYLAAFDQGTSVIVRSVQLDPVAPPPPPDDADPTDTGGEADSGCGCRLAGATPARGAGALALLLAAAAVRAARRRR